MANKGEIKLVLACNDAGKQRGGAVRATFEVKEGGRGSVSLHGTDLTAAEGFDPDTDYDVTFTPRPKPQQ